MAYTIYFGYLPKSTLIVDRSTNIVLDSDLSKLYSVEVAQISFTRNGGASFIIAQTQHKIDHMAFACYNAFFIKTMNYDDDGVYQGYSITTYDITDISYSQATNVKITGILSPYNLALSLNYSSGGNNTHMQWQNIKGFNAYVERGYKYDSILNSSHKANFSATADTDLYCLPPFKIKKDILKSSTKVKYDLITASLVSDAVKTIANDIFNTCAWELTYILNDISQAASGGVTISYSFLGTRYKVNNAGKEIMPYTIIFKPLVNGNYINIGGASYNFKIYDSIRNEYRNWCSAYDDIVEHYKPYILSKQISFVPPVIFSGNDTMTITTVSPNNYDLEIKIDSDAYAEMEYIDWYDASDDQIYGSPIVSCAQTPEYYNGDIVLSNLTGLYQVLTTTTFSSADLVNITKNPYVNLHTQELRITDIQGGSYTYPLINLGSYNQLKLKTYIGFNLGEINTYTAFDVSYLNDSVLNSEMTKDYRGLFSSYNNAILFNEDLLKTYMAQNKNFYGIRQNNRDAFFIQWSTNLAGSITSSVGSFVNDNWIGAASNLSNSLYSSASSLLNYRIKIQNEDLQLDNLQSAPDKIAGQENDTLFYSNNRNMGIYVDLYITDGLTKKALFEDFILYGIYINRYVEDASNYIHITNFSGDRTYIKYFKGTLLLKPFGANDTIGDKYVNSYLATDTCLNKLESYLSAGCYTLKEGTTPFKPYDSSSELQLYNTYLRKTNDLFNV